MRERILISVIALLFGGLFISSCDRGHIDPMRGEGGKLSFTPIVEEMGMETILTKAPANYFFDVDDVISVKVESSATGTKVYEYIFDGDKFTGDYLFQADNSYIKTLEAYWPPLGDGRDTVVTDQRLYEDYRQAGRLKATAENVNVLATAEPIPLTFKQEQSRLSFQLAGQSANGLIIKALLLELNAEIKVGEGVKGVGFWAYCAEQDGDFTARIITPPGIEFKKGTGAEVNGRNQIGLITVGRDGTTDYDYRGLIYIPSSTDITLQPNHDYLVTLTPEGYDMLANITIGGFSQNDGNVGIPFQLPVFNSTSDKWELSTVAQLVTMSWLLDGDLYGEKKDDWIGMEFDVVADIVVTDRIIDQGYFKSGVINTNSSKFDNLDRVKDAAGNDLFPLAP